MSFQQRAKHNAAARERMRLLRLDPAFREADAERQRIRRLNDPDARARDIEIARQHRATDAGKQAARNREAARMTDPAHRARKTALERERRADPDVRSRRAAAERERRAKNKLKIT